MGRLITRAAAVVAAGAVAGALGVTAAGAATHPLAVSGAKLWVQRYNGPGNGTDAASSVAVSPAGGTVFVTGQSEGATPGSGLSDYLTVAYNAATGAQLWTARYDGPGTDQAAAVAVWARRQLCHGGLPRLRRRAAVGRPLQRPG